MTTATLSPPTARSPSATPTDPPATPASSNGQPGRLRWAYRCVAGGLAIAAAYFGISWWAHRLYQSITDDAFIEAHIVNIAPEMVSGRIVRFHVEENDRVEQGQVLTEIEPVHYRDQVEQARGKLDLAMAALKRQEASLAKLKKDVPLQIEVARQTLAGARTEEARAQDALKLTTDEVNKSIDEGQASVQLAVANLTLAKQEYDRFMELAAQDATTKRKAQEVTRAHDVARAEQRVADVFRVLASDESTKVNATSRRNTS